MYCPSCGEACSDSQSYCQHCGKQLPSMDGSGVSQGTPSQMTQPGQGPTQPPENYLVGAILTTLFCCAPFGIVSIVYAAQVNTKAKSGDYAGALEYSRKARNWMLASLLTTVGIVALYVLFFMVLAVGSR